jgi:hypothetical protein
VRQFFSILVLFCASFAFQAPHLVLGPNIEYRFSGAAAPIDASGAFVPQANASFDFSWLEPLGADGYGSWKPNKTNYIRFLAGAELSPFYGTVKAGIGFAPLPPPFAFLEWCFIYTNENLFWSDVEMPMKPEEQPNINDAWDAGYIFDRFYKNSSYSQIQSFDFQFGGKYSLQRLDFSFQTHFTIIDITSDYDKKSFDYMRGIPLFSRDYVIAQELSFAYLFDKNFSWNTDFIGMSSGKRMTLPFKSYDKEPLFYFLASTGLARIFNNGNSSFSISPGFFMRGNQDGFIKDSMWERIVLSINYRHWWGFKFGKE